MRPLNPPKGALPSPLPPSLLHPSSSVCLAASAANFFCNPVAAVGDSESNPAQLVQSFSECEFKCTALRSSDQLRRRSTERQNELCSGVWQTIF